MKKSTPAVLYQRRVKSVHTVSAAYCVYGIAANQVNVNFERLKLQK